MEKKTREILEDLAKVQEKLDKASEDLWERIDHTDSDAVQQGAELMVRLNDRVDRYEEAAADLSEVLKECNRYESTGGELAGFGEKDEECISSGGCTEAPDQNAAQNPATEHKQNDGASGAVSSVNGQLFTLGRLEGRNLAHQKPTRLKIGGDIYKTKDWADLAQKFVNWLIRKGRLTSEDIPVRDGGGGDKYFINDRKRHANPKRDAEWKEVGSFYVNTKHCAEAHVENLLVTLEELGATDVDVRIGF